jgi:uncharacterized protein YkwD
MKKLYKILLCSFVGLILNIVISFTSVYAQPINETTILNLTNQERASNGLMPLRRNDKLTLSAYLKGLNMLSENYWAHNSPSGKTPWIFIKNAGYSYRFAGENLASGYQTAEQVMTAWMNSPSHRSNILSQKYQDAGISILNGTLKGKQTVLIVQHFGTSKR